MNFLQCIPLTLTWGLQVSSSRGYEVPSPNCSGSYRKNWEYDARSSSSSPPEDEESD
ncbi:hypothetical protein A2U01_0114805, partial [Trifolium medium]|nr:hypothetical protein [Trifolium medium]